MWQRAMTQGGGGGGTANCYQVFSHNGQLNYVVVKDGEIVHYSYYSNPTSNKTYEDDLDFSDQVFPNTGLHETRLL